jgi:hypothetical protein
MLTKNEDGTISLKPGYQLVANRDGDFIAKRIVAVGTYDTTKVGRDLSVELSYSGDESSWFVNVSTLNAEGKHSGFLPGFQVKLGDVPREHAETTHAAVIKALKFKRL